MYGVQRGFLTEYQTSVKNFMADCAEVGCDIDSPDFASIVLELKHNTRIAYQALKNLKSKVHAASGYADAEHQCPEKEKP